MAKGQTVTRHSIGMIIAQSFLWLLRFVYCWTGTRTCRLWYRNFVERLSAYHWVENLKGKLRLRQLLYRKSLRYIFSHSVPFKVKVNYFLVALSACFGLKKCLGHPLHLTIEPINACDQKCTICETGLNILDRKKKVMALEDFKKIISRFNLDYLEQIFFYFMGEPFLNKEAYDCIRYVADKGLFVSTCTNGNFIDPKRIVESGLSEVNIQIGGMTQKTHETYRIRGDLEKALTNIEEIIRLRNAPDSKNRNIKVICGFILMKHNEHEVPRFLEYCRKIGVDSYNVIGTCLRNHWEGEVYLPSDTRYWPYDEQKYREGVLVPKSRLDNYCGWLYSATNVLVNGDVVPCCRDPKGKYVMGNLLETSFSSIWNNEKYRRLRGSVATKSSELPLCSLCPSEHVVPLGRNL